MLSHCHKFKIFGNGGNRLIFIAEDGDIQTAYIVNNPFLRSLEISSNSRKDYDLSGNVYMCQGSLSSELNFQAGEVEIVSGKDVAEIYDPVMQKSVVELMKVVNKKLSQRSI